MTEPEAIVVLVTAGSEAEASSIGRRLVELRLAACANVVPGVRSIYRWQGRVVDEPEWLLVVKSRHPLFDRLEEVVREVHSYDVPEVICLPVVAGSRAYFDWIQAETEAGD